MVSDPQHSPERAAQRSAKKPPARRGTARNTKQRLAIRSVFEHHPRPLSPQEILDFGQAHAEGLSLPTVYRALKAMTSAGELVPVELPGQPARYELHGLNHHHHFLCESCGRMFDIPGCPGAMQAMAPEGFHVQRHDLTLIGLCPECHKG